MRAFVKGHRAQCRPADVARVIEHRGEIDPARSRRRDGRAVDRADQFGAVAGSGNPFAARIIEQGLGFHDLVGPFFIVIASGEAARQSRAPCDPPWIASSPSASRNDDVMSFAGENRFAFFHEGGDALGIVVRLA